MTLEEWCDNSRRWIAFMLPKPPNSCPYSTPQNGYRCIGEECAYYRMREPSKRYRHVSKILFSEDSDNG